MPPKRCSKKAMKSAIGEKGFTHISTEDDGNCLYHSIREYATKMGDRRFDGMSSKNLRNAVAVAMKADIDTIVIFSANSNSNIVNGKVNIEKKRGRIRNEINTYVTDLGAWAAEIGDQAPIYASKLFNIRLHIHRWNSTICAFVQDTVIEPREIGEGAPAPAGGAGAAAPAVANDDVLDIHLVHIDNVHYEVMFPKKAPATRKKPANNAKEIMKTLKKAVKGRTNNAIMNNLAGLIKGATIASGSSSSGSSSSSGETSALRRSRRIGKLATLAKRQPTPPKKSSGTRKPTIAQMRKKLRENGFNIPKNARNDAIIELYKDVHSRNSA